ncbi:MAG TPA: serine hydrolase, partial [Pyrinomonadaceae bacterium]
MVLRSILFTSLTSLLFAVGCTSKTAIPTEFPTPEPPPAATPVPAIALKRDADLEKQFASIAEAAKGKVGAAAVVLETGDAALLNADGHYPMQSVYKLPICMAMMDQIRLGQHDLDEKIGVTPADYVRQGQASAIRDKFPNGGEFTIRDLIRYTLVESDGSASDVLLRVMGGAAVVQDYIEEIGIQDMQIVNTEKELGHDWDTQYKNWATPVAAISVIRHLCAESAYENCGMGRPTDGTDDISFRENIMLIFWDMSHSATGPNRIRGLLPKNVQVAHKTGTGGTQNGITSATNDIGVLRLPSGNHLAIAVFV